MSSLPGSDAVPSDVREAARDALRRGWSPIPIPEGSKRPTVRGWEHFKADPARVDETFPGNLGLLLGDPSNGLADVDSDTVEAAALAARWLPSTGLRHGRPGNRRSHGWYLSVGPSKVCRFKAPDGTTLIELRGTGGQTVLPPSRHPSGELYEWESYGEPTSIPFEELRRRVARVAAGALLARTWPANGSRHDAALALGGYFLPRGVTDAADFVEAVATVAGDEEAADRRRAVVDTARTLANGEPITGAPTAEKIFGKDVLKRVADWMGLPSRQLLLTQRLSVELEGLRRPIIKVDAGKLPAAVDAAQRALEGSGTYQRGGLLVRPVRGVSPTVKGVWREPSALTIVPVTSASLVEELTRRAEFKKFDARAEGYVPIDCPDKVAATLLARGEWPLPVLAGIVTAPTMRPDGSPLQVEGYDEATGLLVDFGGTRFPEIPREPSRLDAERALELLGEIIRDFPFVAESDRAAALAGLLTPLVRRSLPSAPILIYTAPKPRSGKTLQACLGALIATGHRPTIVSFSADPAEERKKLFSVFLAGDQNITIDNISGELSGDTLCTVLTEPVWSDRLLGQNRTATVPTNASISATGNGLIVSGDLSSRALPVEIDPACEAPEEREFDVDLYEEVPRRRPELVAAGITIMRAYWAAGRPPQGRPRWGGFDEWCRWVRDPLVWLGCEDPCVGRAKVAATDPVRQDLGGLLAAWEAAFGREAKTVAEVVRAGDGVLREAILQVAGTIHGEIKTRKLAYFIRDHAKRIEGGRRFITTGGAHGSVIRWRVETL